MFARWLEKTRQKSEDQKRLIAFGMSFAITAVIFAGWLFFIVNTRIQSPENIAAESTASPIQAAKSFFKNIVE